MPDVCGSSRAIMVPIAGWLTDRFGRVLVIVVWRFFSC